MDALIGLAGFLGIIIFLVMLVIKIIKKQPKRNTLILLGICIVFFITGMVMTPNKTESEQVLTEHAAQSNTSEQISQNNANAKDDSSVTEDATVDSEQSEQAEQPELSESTKEIEPSLSFVLMEELGEYGEYVTLNKDTEFEETEIIYHVPAGHYDVTNLNTVGAAQVTVYCGGPEYDGEWQYFVADDNCAKPIVVMPGETKSLSIDEGQFVVLSDGSENIQFIMN